MDDLDLLQDALAERQQALMDARRLRAEKEASIAPPAYRECQECGEEIPQARLKLKPNAIFCVDCQEDFEAGRL